MPGQQVDHNGIKVQLLGQIELATERGNPSDFLALSAPPCEGSVVRLTREPLRVMFHAAWERGAVSGSTHWSAAFLHAPAACPGCAAVRLQRQRV